MAKSKPYSNWWLFWRLGIFGLAGLGVLTLPVWQQLSPLVRDPILETDAYTWGVRWLTLLAAPVTALLTLWLVVYLARQKHTYTSMPNYQNAVAKGLSYVWMGVGWGLFVGSMSLLPFFFVVVPAHLVAQMAFHVGFAGAEDLGSIWFAIALLVAALVGLWASVTVASRSFWLWMIGRQIENLPTSKVATAAKGLVELNGTVVAADEAQLLFGTAPGYQDVYEPKPFFLEDDSGRVRVQPPDDVDYMNARYVLRRKPETGLVALMHGDRVHVIGYLGRDPGASPDATGPERLVLRAFEPPFGHMLTRLLRAIGLEEQYRLFAVPDVFVVASGDEREAKRALFRERLFWAFGSTLLSAGSITVLMVAVAALAGTPALQSVTPPLVPKTAWESSSSPTREWADSALGPAEIVIPLVVERLDHPRAEVRRKAISWIRIYAPGATAALPILAARLSDAVPWIRDEAADTLTAFGPAAVLVVESVFAGSDADTQIAAMDVLIRIHDDPSYTLSLCRKLLSADSPLVRASAASRLGTLGDIAEPAVLDLILRLEDEDGETRAAALSALNALEPMDLQNVPLGTWVGFLEAESYFAQRDASAVIRRLNPEPDALIPLLLECLDSERAGTESRAIELLGELGPAAIAAAPFLDERAADASNPHRVEAVAALAKLGADELFLDYRDDSDAAIRRAVVNALPGLAGPRIETIRHLSDKLDDPEPNIRLKAMEHLRALVAEAISGKELEALIQALLEGLTHDDRALRRVAVRAIGKMRPAYGVPPHLAWSRSSSECSMTMPIVARSSTRWVIWAPWLGTHSRNSRR